MSKATIIMIVHANGDAGIDRLNTSFAGKIGINGCLTRVDGQAPDWDSATAVHIGSFNHLDEPQFMRLVRAAAWGQQEKLQVFIEREDESAFTEYDLYDQIVPRQVAERAINHGAGLSMPTEQCAFLEQLRAGFGEPAMIDVKSPWMFEVTAIHPRYYFEANTCVVPYDTGTAIDTNGFRVSPVDLAMEGVGVRWGSGAVDILDYSNDEARKIVHELSPGDRVKIEGRLRVEANGLVTLYEIRSLSKVT